MVKKQSASSVHDNRVVKNVKYIPDSKLDFEDIPELTDEEITRGRRVGRPQTGHAKQIITIRIDPRLLVKLRKLAEKQHKPYQTFIHELLEREAKRVS